MPDLSKSLDQLDPPAWGEPNYSSRLVAECHRLRKVPLKDFTAGDLRLLISQNINLEILVPLAIERLQEDILVEGDYYPGDLLAAVLGCAVEYWEGHPKERAMVEGLYAPHREGFASSAEFRAIQTSFEQFMSPPGSNSGPI